MSGIVWSELFPTKLTVGIFLGYIALFISQGILVTASQDESSNYQYDIVCVVLLTEFAKLLASAALYCKSKPIKSLVGETFQNRHLLFLYFIPSLLYCIYNNLTFKNLSTFDPTTYYLLLQFRVVITGILFQVIFKKVLKRRQWFSLILLTFGCMLKQLRMDGLFNENDKLRIPPTTSTRLGITHDNNNNHNNANQMHNIKNTSGFDLSIDAIYIFIQLICSCLAGVYNEYLLKGDGARVNIYVQNIFMYVDSIVCNLVFLMLQGNLLTAFNANSLRTVFTLNVIVIIINNAAIGIVTSFFLRYLNSILKTFASALELLFTAILCYIFFGIPIYLNTILSIGVVSFAIYFYSLSPVVNLDATSIKEQKQSYAKQHDTVHLLKDYDIENV